MTFQNTITWCDDVGGHLPCLSSHPHLKMPHDPRNGAGWFKTTCLSKQNGITEDDNYLNGDMFNEVSR